MKMFKNSKGELLRANLIETITPVSQWMDEACGDGTETHVVCTAGANYPLYQGDFERLMQLVESTAG